VHDVGVGLRALGVVLRGGALDEVAQSRLVEQRGEVLLRRRGRDRDEVALALSRSISSRAFGNGRRSGRWRDRKTSARRSPIALPSGVSSATPITSGRSLSPPMPISGRMRAKSTWCPCSRSASTQACACASLLSMSVPSTSKITPRAMSQALHGARHRRPHGVSGGAAVRWQTLHARRRAKSPNRHEAPAEHTHAADGEKRADERLPARPGRPAAHRGSASSQAVPNAAAATSPAELIQLPATRSHHPIVSVRSPRSCRAQNAPIAISRMPFISMPVCADSPMRGFANAGTTRPTRSPTTTSSMPWKNNRCARTAAS
jgi:hypothetical protein